jgi:pilus assembly protein CpaC
MANRALIRTIALTVLAAVAVLAMSPLDRTPAAELRIEPRPAPAAAPALLAASEAGSSFVPLGIGKSVVIELPGDVKDVLVADPKIANAVIRSARRAYLIGVTVGQTSIYFFDAQGRQLAGFDIAVTRRAPAHVSGFGSANRGRRRWPHAVRHAVEPG